jgi:hypothetical protein
VLEILSCAVGCYRRHPLLFALLALGVVAPYELIVLAITGSTPLGQQRGSVSTALVLLLIGFVVVGPLIAAFYIHALRDSDQGRAPVPREVVARGLRVLPNVAAAQIVATIGIAVGLLLFVIPGVILLLRWAVVAQAAAIANENWVEALKRSAELTRRHYWHVLGLVLITGVIEIVLLDIGFAVAGSRTGVLEVIVGIVFETITRSFTALTLSVLFFDLRARQQRTVAGAWQ